VAVDVRPHAGTVPEGLPLLAAGQGGGDLHALTVPHGVVVLFAGETAASQGVEGGAEGGDGDAEDAVLRGHLSLRADDLFAESSIDIVPLDAGKTLLEASIKVKAFHRDIKALQSHGVLSLSAFNDNFGAGAVGVQLVELGDTGEALSAVGVEGAAGEGGVEAGIIHLILVGGTGD
jgi:hypothetical protein